MTIAVGTTIRNIVRIAGKIDKKYNLNKIFVEKYVPPGYRKNVNKLIDVALTGSGTYGLYKAFIDDDGAGNPVGIPQRQRPTTYKQYKTRSRYLRSKFQYKQQQRHRCRCPKSRPRYL